MPILGKEKKVVTSKIILMWNMLCAHMFRKNYCGSPVNQCIIAARGGGGERDEVWDRETMFSQLAKRSPLVMVSG